MENSNLADSLQIMSNTVTWTDSMQAICSLLAALVSILGFIILFVQLRQINTSIQSQSHSSIYQMGITINTLMIENSTLMPYLYGLKEAKPDSDIYYKCRQLCESILDFYEFNYLERERINKGLVLYTAKYMKRMFDKNTIMQAYLAEFEDSYDKGFAEMLTKPS